MVAVDMLEVGNQLVEHRSLAVAGIEAAVVGNIEDAVAGTDIEVAAADIVAAGVDMVLAVGLQILVAVVGDTAVDKAVVEWVVVGQASE